MNSSKITISIEYSELDSSVSDQYSISNSFVLASLGEYVGKTLIISVTGSDLAGNPVESNLLRVQIRDKIEPRWEGLVCLEFSAVDLTTQ